ncbi:MAG TPA: hypothetical protein VH374_21455 [Polyangia bacterium]|nr:hypothetical protein [Polyangia bacterium]
MSKRIDSATRSKVSGLTFSERPFATFDTVLRETRAWFATWRRVAGSSPEPIPASRPRAADPGNDFVVLFFAMGLLETAWKFPESIESTTENRFGNCATSRNHSFEFGQGQTT